MGCALDQIAKSIVFYAPGSDFIVLFIAAGSNRIEPGLPHRAAGEALRPAGATLIRARTGFAIGGVAPIGHLTPPVVFFDPRLLDFDVVWAAAGTPRHVFPIAPGNLQKLSTAQASDFTA
ncbi:MAG: YbaK/EbsC family protein [Pseudomonadota bacterium]